MLVVGLTWRLLGIEVFWLGFEMVLQFTEYVLLLLMIIWHPDGFYVASPRHQLLLLGIRMTSAWHWHDIGGVYLAVR